jgi:hypothetical protein
VTPRRVEDSLLVVEEFTDSSGADWHRGDRAPLARRAVRQAALEHPERFVMEFETADVDEDWLRELDHTYTLRYEDVKRRREAEAENREKALRQELKEQDRPSDRDLERRFKQQETDKAERQKRARDKREREQIERELELGFHH